MVLVLLGLFAHNRAFAAVDSPVLKTDWIYLFIDSGAQCYQTETAARDAMLANTGGFCRWTDDWPNTRDINSSAGWCPPPNLGSNPKSHYESRPLNYVLWPGESCSPPNEIGASLTREFYYYCDSDSDLVFADGASMPVCRSRSTHIEPAKQPPACMQGDRGGTNVSNPIDIATGNKCQHELDYLGAGAFPLRLERHYSNGVWKNSYERSISVIPLFGTGTNSVQMIWVRRPEGHSIPFETVLGVLQTPDADIVERLEQVMMGGVQTGWSFVDGDDNVELYDMDGKLLSITTRAGLTQTVTHDGAGRVSTVSDPHGHQLVFAYDTSGRLTGVTDPVGGLYQYGYDTTGHLSTVTYPDLATRTYLYNEPAYTSGANLPDAITGILDENNHRFATYTYDAQGRAIQTEHAGGAQRATIAYVSETTRQVTDAANAVRTVELTVDHNVARIATVSGPPCAHCGYSASYAYDPNGSLQQKTDFGGSVHTYSYSNDGRNLEVGRTDIAGLQTQYTGTTWHSTLRLPMTITHGLQETSFTRDAAGNPLTRTVTDLGNSATRTWTYTYNAEGQVLTENGPRTDVADVTTYTYYSCSTGYECGQVHTVTNAAAQTVTFNTYNAHGQPLTITDANGVVTTLAYDARARLISRVTGSESTTYSYWPTGLLKKVTLPDGSYVVNTYDDAHRLVRIEDGAGNYISYVLDAMGNRTAERVYDPASVLTRTRTRVFNVSNQLWKQIGSAGTAAVTTVFGYDGNSNVVQVDAPLSRSTSNQYDELSRVTQVTDPESGVTRFDYDTNDNLTNVVDPRGFWTTYTYSGFGDLQAQASPDTGTSTNTYDAAGNLQTATDARGAVTSYTYDALNRVSSAAFALGGTTDQTISYTYDSGTNGKGHLTGASDANHSVSWTYDAQGRVTGKSQTVGSVVESVGYGYTNGNLTSITTPSGQTLSYGYTNGRVTSITLNGSTTILQNLTYEPFGPVKSWSWGNGTTTTRTYDADGNVTQIATTGIGQTNTYTYDDAFRITAITDTTTAANSWTYSYDALDRVTSAAKTGTTRGWTYDANGNRLSETGSAPSTYTVSSTTNRVSSITGALARTYGYDSAGNTLSYASLTATYNNRGRMKTLVNGASTETMVYDALGRMIKTSGGAAGTVLYVYDEAGHLLGEYTSTGALVQETVWLGELPVATLRPKSGGGVDVFYVHTDHLNTPRRISRPSDNQLRWTWLSDPFGTEAANGNPASLGAFAYNLRFPGQLFDGQAGLHYNYFRDYDPATGRYIESDPIGLGSGVNTYTYAEDDPVEVPDRFGLDTAQCTRRLNNVPFRVGPLFHQYVCVGNSKTGYTCKGLGPSGGMFNSPGKIETDSYSPKACQTVLPENKCVEDCIKKTFNSPPPNYSVNLSHGDNCQTYANSTVSECVANCHAKQK